MRAFFLLLLAIGTLLTRPALAQTPLNLTWRERPDLNVLLPPSVRVFETSTPLPGGRPLRATYARLDLRDRNLRLRAVGETRGSTFRLRTPFEYDTLNRALVTINGGFFSSNASVSLVITDGEGVAPNQKAIARGTGTTARTFFPTRGAFGLLNRRPDVAWVYGLGGSTDGGDNLTHQYANPSPNNAANAPQPVPTASGGEIWPASQAIGGGPVLVQNGTVRVTTTEELFEDIAPENPRTAVGYLDDNTVIMLVVDGRQAASAGVTLVELAQVMAELGCREALNLDGGGSSAMVAADEVANLPSDNGRNALRAVASALVVSEATPTPRRQVLTLETDGNAYAETGLWRNDNDRNNYGPTVARLTAAPDARATYRFASVPPGRYQLAAWWTVNAATNTTQARYILTRGNRRDTLRFNQSDLATAGKWNVLGEFELGTNDRLDITNAETGKRLLVDALRLVTLERFPAQATAARGDLRIAVISDLNSGLGSNTYEWQVDSIMQRIPRIWRPDMVVTGGDMVAGQGVFDSLVISRMWRGFDEKIARPFRTNRANGQPAPIPFAFTMGNHDGSRSFALERRLTKRYWDTTATGLTYVDRSNFPYWYSYRQGDAFFVSWDASSSRITDENLAWVREQFARPEARTAKMRFVVGHMPLYAVAQERNNFGDVLDRNEELRALLQELNVKAYISGHHHAFYPAKRGKLEMLNAGAAGSGPRQWLTLTRPAENTVTIMDLFYEKDSIAYTTYEIQHRNAADMPVLDPRGLPAIIYGVNGFTIRRDQRVGAPLAGVLSTLNLPVARPEATPTRATGQASVQIVNNVIRVTGTFAGLAGPLLPDRGSAGLYEGDHGSNGRLLAALNVTSTDGRSGSFSGNIPATERWLDQLAGGGVHLLLRTTAGDVRSQLYAVNNAPPSRPVITSVNARNVYAVRNLEALFPIRWSAGTSPDGDPVTYLYQLARDSTFAQPLLQTGTGRVTDVRPREQDLYELLRQTPAGQATTLFHRVVATDGRNVVNGPAQVIQLTRSDAPLDDLVEVPAPNYVYDGRLAPGAVTTGYGTLYDRAGKLWLSTFSNLIYVLNPDVSQPAWSPVGTVFGASSNNTGISLDRDGNVLVARNSQLFKVNAQTGEVMARWQSPVRSNGAANTLTTPRVATDGRVYVSSLWNEDFIYVLELPVGASTYVQARRITLPGRILARTFAMTPDARVMYLPNPTAPQIQQFTTADGGQTYALTATITSVAAGTSSLEVGPNNELIAAVRPSGVLPTTLHVRNDSTKRLWTLPLPDDGNTEPRGSIAFSRTRDTLIIPSWAGSGGWHRYVLRREGATPLAPAIRNIPTYRIRQVRGINATTGVADSLNVYCAVEGIVNSPNFGESGLDFALADGPAALNVTRREPLASYPTPRPGDRLRVVGRLTQVAGLTRLLADSVRVLGTNATLATPLNLTGPLRDSLEMLPVKLTNARLVDATQWTKGQGYYGFGVDVTTDGTNRYRVFIDRQSPLYNADAPQTPNFDLTGIVSQFDEEAPLLSGYEIHVRTLTDLTQVVTSTEDNLPASLTVSPNPTAGPVRIVSEARNLTEVRMTDPTGRLLKTFNWKARQRTAVIDLTNLRPGVYILVIQAGDRAVTRRVVKE